MSTQDLPVASSSTQHHPSTIKDAPTSLFNRDFHLPTRFLLLVPSSVGLGIVIGMYRGGRKARLRFIAENAHRQPRTYQGWYFYSKTRNYKIMYQASLVGGKTALTLGGATATYVFLEEYGSYLRESVFGTIVPREREFRPKVTWRSGGPVWYDGTIAGTISALGIGLIWRLPRGLFFRAIWLGAILGTAESWSRVLSTKIAESIPDEEKPAPVIPSPTLAAPSRNVPEHPVVDREPQPGPLLGDIESFIEDRPSASSGQSWWSTAKSWIPGL